MLGGGKMGGGGGSVGGILLAESRKSRLYLSVCTCRGSVLSFSRLPVNAHFTNCRPSPEFSIR